eukprot:TRINITY_DN2661_c0_g1_i9.p1 TRINITY_DN2661_c0_g1~~TRINITY_DN2661_c0_g1_i9.p1  ORF type:complete len:2974 (-),score=547.90 TRINITY_DN2661_c0_g1_i9:92-7951(-)
MLERCREQRAQTQADRTALPAPTPTLLAECRANLRPPACSLHGIPRVATATRDTQAVIRAQALKICSSFPLAPDPSPANVLKWARKLSVISGPSSSLNRAACFLLLDGVESFVFRLASERLCTLECDFGPEKLAEAQALREISTIYCSAAASLLGSEYASYLPIHVETRSVLILVMWAVCCLIHQIVYALLAPPLRLLFGCPLRKDDLQNFVLADNDQKGAALLAIGEYLGRDNERNVSVFSTRSGQEKGSVGFALAYCQASPDSAPANALAAERQRQEAEITSRYDQIKRQKEYLVRLDSELRELQSKLSVANSELESAQRDMRYVLFCSVDQISRESQARREVYELERSIHWTERNIASNEKAPAPIFMPLPEESELAQVVIFFTHMEPQFRVFAQATFDAQKAFVTGGFLDKHEDDGRSKDPFALNWAAHFNRYSSSSSAMFGQVEYRGNGKPPDTVGERNVRRIFDRMDGIWFPDYIARRSEFFWAENPDPFRISPTSDTRHLTKKVYTEQLKGDQAWLQWGMPLFGADWDGTARGNYPLANQQSKPSTIRKPDFLCLGALRGQPLSQLRQLAVGLKEARLPLERPEVQILIRQLLYSTGKVDISRFSKKFDRLWSTGHRQWPEIVGLFQKVLDSWIKNVAQAPGRYAETVAVVDILSFFCSNESKIFTPLCIELSNSIKCWADSLSGSIEASERSDGKGAQALKTRKCIFYALALLCYRHVEHSESSWIDLVRLGMEVNAALPRNGAQSAVNAKKDSDLALSLHSRCLRSLSARSSELAAAINANLAGLSKALACLIDIRPAVTVEWSPVPIDFQAAAFYEGVSSDGHVYHINVLTGLLLVNGLPPGVLPDPVLNHKLYRRIFGTRNFSVSVIPGGFETLKSIDGCHYRFFLPRSLQRELVIHEQELGTGLVLQLLDHDSEWNRELPDHLRELYSHWEAVDGMSEKFILFRAVSYLQREIFYFWRLNRVDSALSPVPENIQKTESGAARWRDLVGHASNLLQMQMIRSPSPLSQIVGILGAVESAKYIHTFLTPTKTIQFHLPRINLKFQLNEDGVLSSLTFTDFYLPTRQRLPDTLHEFSSYLILEKTKLDSETLVPVRKILVPRTENIERANDTWGVSLKVSPSLLEKIQYVLFVEHPRLKRLEASSIEARLFLAVIYAATGTLLPETRTGLTGAEFAFEMVRQCWTTVPLTPVELTWLQLLKKYSEICPALSLRAEILARDRERLAFLFNPEVSSKDLKPGLLAEPSAKTKYRAGLIDGTHSLKSKLTPEEARDSSSAFIGVAKKGAGLEVLDQAVQKLPDPPPTICPDELVNLVEKLIKTCVVWKVPQDLCPEFPIPDASGGGCKLWQHLIEGLKKSWKAHHTKPVPETIDIPSMCAPLKKTVDSVCQDWQAHLLHFVDNFGFDSKSNAAALGVSALAANIRVRCTLSDLLQISFNPAWAAELNSNFRYQPATEALRSRVLKWMQLCVLADRLERLLSMAVLPPGEARRDVLVADLCLSREWRAQAHPRWLVFEVVGRLQIRPQQYAVVKALLENPEAGRIEQLNMGEGKTRVIVPMLILAWADGRRCVRLHFLPRLLADGFDDLHRYLTASELHVKLAQLPFHRDVDLTVQHRAQLLVQSVEAIVSSRGALVVAPEHRLSSHLKALELRLLKLGGSASSDKLEYQVALACLRKLEHDFVYYDIFDESDAVLSYRYQLIYAAGSAAELPDLLSRCSAIECVLSALALDPGVQGFLSEAPESCAQVMKAPASYLESNGQQRGPHEHPSVSLLHGPELQARMPQLLKLIATYVFQNPPKEHSEWIELIQESGPEGIEELVKLVCEKSQATSDFPIFLKVNHHKAFLLALRGLLAHGTLSHALTLRHNVDYGIDTRKGRTRLAVPYRASQTPSDRAEYAHPDLALVLTFLSYMKEGLNPSQLEQAFRALIEKSPSSKSSHYERWFRRAEQIMHEGDRIPLNSVQKIDLSNPEQREKLFRYFSRCPHTVWFYLIECVLPEGTKIFTHRLASTPWDLCHSWNSESRCCGFSGTNDTAMTMPLQVHQGDPEALELRATNGKMLAILSATERCVELSVEDPLDALRVAIEDQGCSAFIDAGALMCGFSNEKVAETIIRLLKKRQQHNSTAGGPILNLKGVLFVSQGHWMIWDLDGGKWRKREAPHAERDTFVYYDESHTRGADVKLRPHAVGLLTVSKKLQKDPLMQAAGRLRQLAQNQKQQRLVLGVMSDAAAKLRESLELESTTPIQSIHVLRFVLDSTAQFLKSAFPAFVQQGLHFCRTNATPADTYQAEVLELEQLYFGAATPQNLVERLENIFSAPGWKPAEQHLLAAPLRAKVQAFGSDIIVDAAAPDAEIERRGEAHQAEMAVQDECERELQREQERELEQERQIPKSSPQTEKDWDWMSVWTAQTAKQLRGAEVVTVGEFSKQFLATLKQNPIWNRIKSVYLTRNFHNTVNFGYYFQARDSDMTQYLRLVDAFLFFPASGDVVLISEREEEKLLQLRAAEPAFPELPGSGAILANFSLIKQGEDGTDTWPMSTAFGTHEIVRHQLPELLVAAIELFSGETNFPPVRKALLRRQLLLEPADKMVARNMADARGLGSSVEGSPLEDAARLV